jgi:hypothetical protein
MSDWIYLSKGGKDPYINMFAKGCNALPTNTDTFDFNGSSDPILMRGILKDKIIEKCYKSNRDFYFMDTGYFGNEINSSNPNGWKYWHRITKNDLQLNDMIIPRPDDRWSIFKRQIRSWKKTGRKILFAKPDEKPCKFYKINLEEWSEQVIQTLKENTDRPIVVRERNKNRLVRTTQDTFLQALNDDVFALVTFNSNAAVEAIMNGIPAFVLAPTSAAKPVAETDLSKIESPYYADSDKLYAWACHLAYGQFHVNEFKSGKAKSMLEEL